MESVLSFIVEEITLYSWNLVRTENTLITMTPGVKTHVVVLLIFKMIKNAFFCD